MKQKLSWTELKTQIALSIQFHYVLLISYEHRLNNYFINFEKPCFIGCSKTHLDLQIMTNQQSFHGKHGEKIACLRLTEWFYEDVYKVFPILYFNTRTMKDLHDQKFQFNIKSLEQVVCSMFMMSNNAKFSF